MNLTESESYVLAGILPTHSVRMETARLRNLKESNFSTSNFKVIWRYLSAYYDEHMNVIPRWVLSNNLERDGHSDAKRVELLDTYDILSKHSVLDHEFKAGIDILKEDEVSRRTDELIVSAREILRGEYYDPEEDQIIRGQDKARAFLSEGLQSLEVEDSEYAPEGSVKDDVEQMYLTYLQKEENPEQSGGIHYGIPELDDYTGGVRAGELVLVAGFTGSGKASPLWEKVLTPTGWTTIGELEVGSTIIDRTTGGNQTVVGVHDRGVMDTYRVTTRNGDSVLVAGDHLWQVQTSQQRNGKVRSSNSVLTTDEIREGLSKGRRYYVPVTRPVEFEASVELPFGAYAVGALLGDGSLTQRVEITSHTSDSPEVVSLVSVGLGMDHRVVHDLGHKYRYRFPSGNLDMYNLFKELGMTCTSLNKFIPEMYLRASLEDRLELLRGLMDTDGTVAAGTPEFSTSSQRLAEDVRELVKSLGGIVGSLRSKIPTYRNSTGDVVPGNRAYSFTVKLPNGIIPFHLKRKASLVKSENRLTKHGFDQPIKSIERVGAEEVRCISVSGPSHLYITSDYLVTHNSHMVTSLAWNAMRAGKNVLMFTTETTREEMEIRIIARHSRLPKFKNPDGLNSHEILEGKLKGRDREVFRDVLTDFKNDNPGELYMVQMPVNGFVDYVHAKASEYNRKAPIDLVIIDSINLLRTMRRYPSKREMLEDLLQDFKRFASAFDNGRGVAVVSPWQMSRNAWQEAKEAGGIYTLASLADTSEAEKALPLTSRVLSPQGWKTMGEIGIGDTIIDPLTGGTQEVTDTFDNVQDIYKLTFEDGTSAECGPGHLWYVRTTWNGNRPLGWMTITTIDLMDKINRGYKFASPIMKAPDLSGGNPSNFVIPPYAMGALLGDGSFRANSIEWTTGDAQLVEEMKANLTHGVTMRQKDKFHWIIKKSEADTRHPWIAELRRLGLWGMKSDSKFIPDEYKWASVEDRLALFQGYMDADGEATFKDTGFSTGSAQLSEDMRWLASSLGVKISTQRFFYPKGGKVSYRTSVLASNHMDIFRLERKKTRRRKREEDSLIRYIRSVEATGKVEPTRCIRVSGEDKLYVIDDFVVTHNCLPLDGRVLTMQGFKEIKDVHPGESIVDSDGLAQEVLEEHDNGVLPIYLVTTNDGAEVKCTPQHIWTVKINGKFVNRTAQQLMEDGGEYEIPVLSQQPDFHAPDLVPGKIFNPTILGWMLKAGESTEEELVVIPQYTHTLTTHLPFPTYVLRTEDSSKFVYEVDELKDYLRPELFEDIRQSGVMTGDPTKFRIPVRYLNASHHVREALVRAFMADSQKNLHQAKVSYEDISMLPFDHPGIGAALKYLVASLGWPLEPVPRKIVSVVDTGTSEPTKCITVSNPNGLFVTDGFVLTHNSSSQIITLFKKDDGQLNIQVIKNRSGMEMAAVSYPYDYRNSFIGTSGDSPAASKPKNAKANITMDVISMMGD